MSGLSLAVGPRPGEKRELEDNVRDHGVFAGLMGSLRTIELQLVAFIVVFSVSGLISLMDLLFPVFVSVYLFIISRIVFPTYPTEGRMEVFRGSRMFQLYVGIGTVIGLFLPLAYVLGGFARGDQHAVKIATPHLFLLSVQILSENIISGLSVFSPPVRVLAALLYTARRIFTLSDWVNVAFFQTSLPPEPGFKDISWLWFGRSLAAANFVYFNINMFCFLIPRFLPRAFERYLPAKTAHMSAPSTKAAHTAGPSAKTTDDKPAAVENKAEKKTQ
eukprot:c23176_g1_i2 orf=494-1318(-)